MTTTTLADGYYQGLLNDGTIIRVWRVTDHMLEVVPGVTIPEVGAPAAYWPGDRGFSVEGEPMLVRFRVSGYVVSNLLAI